MTIDREPGIVRGQLDEVELNMLRAQRISYLLPIDWLEIDGRVTFRYTLTGMKMLLHRLQQQPITMQQYYTLILGVTDALLECKDYMLRPEGCLLGDQFIFTGDRLGDIRLAYIPLKNIDETHSSIGGALLSLVVRWTTYVESIDGTGLKRILQLLDDGNGSMPELRDTLLDLIAKEHGGADQSRRSGFHSEAQPANQSIAPASGISRGTNRFAGRGAEGLERLLGRNAKEGERPLSRGANDADRSLSRSAEDMDQSLSREAEDMDQSLRREEEDVDRTFSRDAKDMKRSLGRSAGIGGSPPIRDAGAGRTAIRSAGDSPHSPGWPKMTGKDDDELPYLGEEDGKERGGRGNWLVGAAFVLSTACVWRFVYVQSPSSTNLLISAGLTLLLVAGGVVLWRRGSGLLLAEQTADEASRYFDPASGPLGVSEPLRRIDWRQTAHASVGPAESTTNSLGNRSIPVKPYNSATVNQSVAPTELLNKEKNDEKDGLKDGAQSGSSAWLNRVWNGQEELIELAMDRFKIGRSGEAAAYEDNAEGVSRIHLEIERINGVHLAKDLGSRNGSLLNGRLMVPYKSYKLVSGDMIQLAGDKGPSYELRTSS